MPATTADKRIQLLLPSGYILVANLSSSSFCFCCTSVGIFPFFMSLCIIKHYFQVSDACFLSIADNLPVASLPECGSLPESRMSDFSKVMQDELPSSEVSDSVEEKRAREVDLNVSCIDGGINLNCGTLKKRLQGKKHRPKVFKEEKALRTPKSETALQERKENTSCKRKYVRRKKDGSHSSETAFNALGEIVDSETYCEAAKSVRRCLNFGLKEQRNVHEFSAAMSMFNKVLRTHALEASNEETNYSRVQSELPTRPSAGVVYDISSSVYQPQNECSNFLQIPVPYSEVNKNICASVKHRTSLKSSVKHFKALARKNACLSLASANARSDQNSNKTSDAPSKSTKRDHLSHDEAEVLAQKRIMHSYNLGGCFSNNYDAKKKNSCLEGIHNRGKILENLGKNDTISPKFVCTSWKTKQLSNSSQEFDFTDAQGFLVKEVWDSRHISSFQKIERYEQSSSVLYTMNSSRKPSFVRPSKQKNQAIIQSSIFGKLSKSSNTLENNRCGSQAHLELSENTMKPLKTSTNMKTKKQDNDHRQMAHLNGVYSAQNIIEGGALATSSWNGKNLHHETITVDYPCTCYYNVFHHASLSSETSVSFIDLLEDAIKKLRHLSISSDHEVSGSQAQNSIVPYANQGGKLVVYEGNFNMIKRRRPRAKVDLDPESNRVWKLLMGKDCGEGDANSYVDKEKWWDEERRVFQGRVDSFIARMHLVQGDRRFSQWKGSVVDSVVGVFLTQNVSDHLSSSAFMSLAANFPLSIGKCSVRSGDKDNTSMENQSRITSLIKTPNLGRNLLDQGAFRCFLNVNVVDKGDQKESKTCSETVGVTTAGKINYYSRQRGKGKTLYSNKKEATISGSGANLADLENIEISDCGFTAQNSAVSSQNSLEFYVQPTESSNLFLSIETDDFLSGNMSNEAFGSSSFTQIFQMEKSSTSEKFYNHGSGMISTPKNQESILTVRNNQSFSSQLDKSKMTIQSTNDESSFYQAVLPLSDRLLPRESCKFDATFSPKRVENNVNLLNDKSRSHLLPAKCKIISGNEFEFMSRMGSESEGSTAEPTNLHKLLSSSKFTATFDSCVPINKLPSQMELDARLNSGCHKNTAECFNGASKNENQIMCSGLETENMKDRNSEFEIERTHNAVQSLGQIKTCRNLQTIISNNKIGCNLKLAHKSETYRLTSPETLISSRKPTKRKRLEVEKNPYDWESLRKEVCNILPAQERSSTTLDSLDWEAVRIADVSKISEAIRERGMNNVLAERIKEFLNRLVREHGSIDLEWLRDIPPDKVKDYLLSIRGLGLKSAECVRLLTLQQLAFPVDTNVGRICVRLGWVPLQPLPESLQLHLLEMYPVLETIQKYLWPRLCKLDQRTLYELHYQMITFGKVFCTKSKPNCNSCPMKGDCRHFASAFASARLYLPAPDDRSVVSFTTPMASEKRQSRFMHQLPLPQLEGSSDSKESTFQKNCEPIVEEPVSPEPECPETLESAIEDAFYEDSDEIPTIKLNFKEFTQNLHNYMEENMKLQDASLSKALVALNPEIASIPMPKLKNVSRLRTEHQVYEIPDTHPLLERVDPREPDDPSPYLLAIWTPGETAKSTEPPNVCCNTGGLSQLCETKACFTCNCMQDSESHMVRGTLLIPCRTATRGSFPLNGTYFQVNEVFADHHSSCNPIYVPREWIWNLPRRTVYFGTSIPTIFRGLTTEEIQQCFWRGFVCVRGFDRITRAPKPLYARLHLPASKAPKNRKAAEPNVEN